jgi:hypothetical protein
MTLMKKRAAGRLLATIGMAACLRAGAARACAMCQTVLPRGDDPLAQGLLWSALILLTAPFIVSGAIGGWIYYCSRKSRSPEHTANATVVPFARTPGRGGLQ